MAFHFFQKYELHNWDIDNAGLKHCQYIDIVAVNDVTVSVVEDICKPYFGKIRWLGSIITLMLNSVWLKDMVELKLDSTEDRLPWIIEWYVNLVLLTYWLHIKFGNISSNDIALIWDC